MSVHTTSIPTSCAPEAVSLSLTRLTANEAAGERSRALGLIGERTHQTPSNHRITRQHVAYRWPADRIHHPLPPRFFA